MEKKIEYAIVGGGPAGSYLGYCLAKKGLHPMIFDDSHPREKPCGGGVSCLAIEKFPLLHQVPVGKSPEKQFTLISPDGKQVILHGDIESWALPRREMDGFLLEKAVEHGCIHVKEHVNDIELVDDTWKIKTNNGVHTADIIIGADGVKSLVRKKLVGPISNENLGICYGCFADGTKNEKDTIKFLKGKLGYAWCFPRHNHLSIGVGLAFTDGKYVKNVFHEFFKEHYSHTKIISYWGALIPFVRNPDFFNLPCCGDNWLLIGDAAGHVDSLTGEGILYALWGAELAAEAIYDDNLSSFDMLWKEAYGDSLIDACKMYDFFYNPFLLELMLKSASYSKTLSTVLYDMLNSIEDNHNLTRRLLKEVPCICMELLKNILLSKRNIKEIRNGKKKES